ncbi:DotU family type IV/VI secretion system protein [Sulfidibacter corallicola]|uniref:DotU family type IV/VI secretion system protein n=1 Tax=Sulfidibacter corallicola TaxID=2818388 RepID=A0A8A4TV73_SULCO|nr:DotU family type IV/VI secretion system protein [Sulfidibacter corallicola]QTD53383.1 DotU family type IV/VI secretion system protein [Sulfidibacter corallicola]
MELRDVTRDLFLFAATFRERLNQGSLPPVQTLYHEAKVLFDRMDQVVVSNPALSARYGKIKYGLVALIDEIIVSSTWSEGPNWPVLELEFYATNIAGNHCYELIKSLTPADVDLIEAWFYILALGFRGELAFEEARWEETLLRLYRQLPQRIDQNDIKLSPEAYHVVARKARRLDPLFSLWRSVILFFAFLVMLIVFYQVVWVSMVDDVKEKSDEVMLQIRDKKLLEELKEIKQ